MATDVVGSALSAGAKIGRSFSVATFLPALLFVIAASVLVLTGAVSGRPEIEGLRSTLTDFSFWWLAALVLVALAVGFVVHPMLFTITQLLEGYWGNSAAGRRLMAIRTLHYRRIRRALTEQEGRAGKSLYEISPALRLGSRGEELVVPLLVDQQQAQMALSSFPLRADRVMPTRLGNILRRYEDAAGHPYGLDALRTAPALTTVAGEARLQYMRESREQLDAAVSVCFFGAATTLVYIGSLLTDGLWLACSLVPYSVAYAAYRGALTAAHEYGTSLSTMVGLDRFALYQALGFRLPKDTNEELELTRVLSGQLSSEHVYAKYVGEARGLAATQMGGWRSRGYGRAAT